MLTPEDVLARLRTRPFVPMRVVTITDQHYDVYHPDMVLVGRGFLEIGLSTSENPLIADSITRFALLHVTELRELPKPTVANNSVDD